MKKKDEETLFDNLTQSKLNVHTISMKNIHVVILSGNRMAGLHLPAIPTCKLYISDGNMTTGPCKKGKYKNVVLPFVCVSLYWIIVASLFI